MCIALPAKILSIKDNMALVSAYSGGKKELDCTLYPEAKKGDFALAYGGRILRLINQKEAIEMTELLNQVAKKDKLFEVIKKNKLDANDIKYLMTFENPEDLNLLYSESNRLREVFLKKSVCVHGVVEFSNYCKSECAYCGLTNTNKALSRYRMTPNEIIKVAKHAVSKLGFKMLVLQSGEDDFYDDDTIVHIIKEIRKGKPVLIFLSIGEKGFAAYKKFRKAGAKGSLFRFETSDPKLYKKIHPDSDLDNRIYHIKFMKELGYLVASGPLVGLPGQTIDSLVNDILLMRELKIDMASIGTFIPHASTKMAKIQQGSKDLTLRTIAATRMALSPNMRIPIATSLETITLGKARKDALITGANSLMLSLTPLKYRRDYSIYPDRFGEKEKIEDLVNETTALVKSLGRRVCKGWGVKLKVQEKADEFLPICE